MTVDRFDLWVVVAFRVLVMIGIVRTGWLVTMMAWDELGVLRALITGAVFFAFAIELLLDWFDMRRVRDR